MSVLPSNSTDDDDQLDGDDNDNEEDVDGKKKSNAYAAAVPEINILGLGAKVMDLLTVSKFVGQIFCIAIGGGDEEADRNELFFYEHGMADGFGFLGEFLWLNPLRAIRMEVERRVENKLRVLGSLIDEQNRRGRTPSKKMRNVSILLTRFGEFVSEESSSSDDGDGGVGRKVIREGWCQGDDIIHAMINTSSSRSSSAASRSRAVTFKPYRATRAKGDDKGVIVVLFNKRNAVEWMLDKSNRGLLKTGGDDEVTVSSCCCCCCCCCYCRILPLFTTLRTFFLFFLSFHCMPICLINC